jgi:hypothetical protein
LNPEERERRTTRIREVSRPLIAAALARTRHLSLLDQQLAIGAECPYGREDRMGREVWTDEVTLQFGDVQ